MNHTAEQVYKFFIGKGLSPAAAAGIVGNAQQESSNNAGAAGGGLIQGQGGRTSSGSLGEQLNGINRELNGPERGTLQALKGAKTPQQAALIFSQRFERPGIPMNQNRERYAQEAARQFGGLSGSPGEPSALQGATGASPQASGGEGGKGGQIAALLAQLTKSQGPTVGDISPIGLEGGPKLHQGIPQEQAPSAALLAALSGLGGGKETGGGGKPGGEAPSTPGQRLSPAGPGAYGALAGAGLTYAGPDQGVDFTGKGVVRAPADIQITRVGSHTGWSGEGNLLVGKILSGPGKGKYTYVAEDFTPAGHLKPGSVVRQGEPLGQATGSGKAPGIEAGFAQNPQGQAYGTTHDGKPGGPEPTYGRQFEQYLRQAHR